ncbi:Dynamitin-domain-containing protein [Calycina marina]|uniref:Dynamitin-domain-containing protein n=1 Tax=Calycina marina TaxID=1763456 RepID=A0A9P8CDE9_9HELO|nr:Dynamitin-domain-containing protein [Calycina marina]
MAFNRKYASLPDLDSAPDTYATPELTDDNSTPLQNHRDGSESASSAYHDFDEDEDAPGIHRGRFDTGEARTLFSPSQVDARDVDFSDRVASKRKSYKTSTRRQGKNGVEEYGNFSDDDESLDQRYARLRREIEEVKAAYSRKNAEKGQFAGNEGPYGQDISQLSRIMDGIDTTGPSGTNANGTKLARDLGTGIRANGPLQGSQKPSDASTYTVTYAPTYQQSHALAKAADFDSRLDLLEKVLGLNTTNIPAANANGLANAVLPSLDTLQHQLSLIQSTPSALDVISRRVRTLTQETDRLEDSRKNAKLAQDALRATGDGAAEDSGDTEQVAKINALFGTLSTIDNLAPMLPSLLDRMRSLRAIHADAASASQDMSRVEKKQSEMADEIKKWTEGLEKVEKSLEEADDISKRNMKEVEASVKDIEQKIGNLRCG